MNAYARWARLVAQSVSAPHDLRTLALWARHVGTSVSTVRARCAAANVTPRVRARCAAANVTPRESRDLGRLLRIVALSNSAGIPWDPAADLDTRDPRTRHQLLARWVLPWAMS